ncbi:hypothetical protein B4088_6625 [Bacillus cereus]|uniref:Uncharacterized protein n=1 Tax=Bacillus cereus TaxID=1396 RepID=A0A164K8U8_BACCE|nr:hypothetical protein B4088_6625 [Bacillus cereus]
MERPNIYQKNRLKHKKHLYKQLFRDVFYMRKGRKRNAYIVEITNILAVSTY